MPEFPIFSEATGISGFFPNSVAESLFDGFTARRDMRERLILASDLTDTSKHLTD